MSHPCSHSIFCHAFIIFHWNRWYLPNYDMAKSLKWGKGLGCDFAMKSCKDWIDTKRSKSESIHPFCDKGEY